MSRQRIRHHGIASRQHTYKISRKYAYYFHYKHKARWRKTCGASGKATRQYTYGIFGPAFLGARRK